MTTIIFKTLYGPFSLAERTNPALGGKTLSQHVQERKPATAGEAATTLEDFFHTNPSASDNATDQVIIRFLHMNSQDSVSYEIIT